jgi:kynurenine formamidase
MARLIDLSHTVEHGMITYKGLPAPIVCDYLSREASRERYAPGTEFHIGKIEMVANTGTYIDSPFHRLRMATIFRSCGSRRWRISIASGLT